MEIASCWWSWACDSGDWRSAWKDSPDFKEMYSLLLKCHTVIWGKNVFAFCFVLNRCMQSCLSFKVFNFYHSFCKTFSQQSWEKETTENHWVLIFFFFLHTEKVGKGLSISVDTETTGVFLKWYWFVCWYSNLMVEGVCYFEMKSCSILQLLSCLFVTSVSIWSVVTFGGKLCLSLQGLREGGRQAPDVFL